jgi:peptidyl-dipeptidase A
VVGRVKRLVALRNREARRLGYANYYAMSLSLQELDEATLFALLEDLHQKTNPLWQAYKTALDSALADRFQVAPGALRPWHYPDPFFQEAPPGKVNLDAFFKGQDLEALTAAFYEAVGLPIRDILLRSDLYEREGKCQHAFCIHVGRFGDVRVLCNCTGSERWMSTLLHEFGHAVYDKYLGSDLPFFLRETAHTMTTEAIAMLMGRLSRHGAWLQRYARVPAAEAKRIEASAQAEMRGQLLILARWCLVMTHFERDLYNNPDQNLNRLWWDRVRKYQGVTAPEGRDEPDWAAKIHLALAPVYYHNYLLGEMFASQLLDHLCETVLPPGSGDADLVQSKAVGTYLREAIFARGARLPWDTLVEQATGEPLNPDHFVRHLGGPERP